MQSQLTDLALRSCVGTLPATGAVQTITTGAAADNNTTALVNGLQYDLVCTEDCYICASATNAANDCTTSDYYLPANTIITFTPITGLLFVSALQVATAGTVFISPRSANYKLY